MPSAPQDPIVAIASAPGRGAVGVVRVSGARLEPLVEALLGRQLTPRQATYLPFLAADGSHLDKGLALYFPAPHSYTGESVLELQAHGGPVVLQLLVARCLEAAAEQHEKTALPRLADLRLAEPGEFTRRAFLNDKLDLAQAEAVADLIDASTEAAARSAGRAMAGLFSDEVHLLRDALIRLRMLVEATLDFPEEEIDFLQQADAQGQLLGIQTQLNQVRQRTRQGMLLRDGLKVVIAGQPNAGKSSLLNALAGAELAIVTPIPGTTRDKVQQTIQIEGVPIHIVDTAGLRDSDDTVEKIGISRAWEAIAQADAVVFLRDLSRQKQTDYVLADSELNARLSTVLTPGVPLIEVWNKADTVTVGNGWQEPQPTEHPVLCLSVKTGDGLPLLRQRLLQVAGWQAGIEGVYIARERHVQALARVAGHVSQAQVWLASRAQSLDLLAEELRLAQQALGEITGEFTSDDLLGVIFSSFCIGK